MGGHSCLLCALVMVTEWWEVGESTLGGSSRMSKKEVKQNLRKIGSAYMSELSVLMLWKWCRAAFSRSLHGYLGCSVSLKGRTISNAPWKSFAILV